MRPLKILTWNTHADYLYYLGHAPHEFYVLSRPGRPHGYGGPSPLIPWGRNVHDMPASEARHHQFDCILFQDGVQYEKDQYELLGSVQRALPRIYIEHDPPRLHPTDTPHPIDDPGMLLVHVANFNALMWNSGRTPTTVIEHGVRIPDGVAYRGELPRGIVIVDKVAQRGRSLGADVLSAVREQIPLDLAGVNNGAMDGVRDIPHGELAAVAARYRFLFNPVRYASPGLAVIGAMMAGVPVVSLATAEMATVIDNGNSGFIDTNLATLADCMNELLRDPALARHLGANGRRHARKRFGIERFVHDWDRAFRQVTGTARVRVSAVAG